MHDRNKNRPGYKETKVGWIPKEWSDPNLGKLGKILSGGTPSSTEESFWNGSVTWVTPTDITKLKTRYISTSARSITDAGLKNSSATLLPPNTLVLCTRATIGECAITTEQMTTNQGFKNLVPNSSVHIDYIYYQIKNQTHALIRLGCGSTFLEVSKTDLSKFHIPLPPLPEQEKIAEVLGCWDEGLESLEKLIEAKKLRKKGLMQQLLTGTRRLPEFQRSDDGGQKSEWKEVRLKDITQRVTRKNKTGCTNNLTISGAHGLINQEEFFNKRVAAHDTSGYFLLKHGEFAYNKSYCNGYPLGAIKRLDRYDEGAVSTLYICFAIIKGSADSNFITQYFENGELNHEIYRVAQEGARNHGLLNITPTDFFDTKLTLPTLEEQKAIADVLETADEEIRLLEDSLAALSEQKKGLMQKLLTGEVRMPQFRAA